MRVRMACKRRMVNSAYWKPENFGNLYCAAARVKATALTKLYFVFWSWWIWKHKFIHKVIINPNCEKKRTSSHLSKLPVEHKILFFLFCLWAAFTITGQNIFIKVTLLKQLIPQNMVVGLFVKRNFKMLTNAKKSVIITKSLDLV